MKKYFIMAIAAAAITSCSQDEVMEVAEKQAITFGNAFVENATRAIDATYSSSNMPSSFLVYGTTQGNEDNAPIVPIFNGVTVAESINTNVQNNYGYSTNYTQYWIDGNTYNFAAIVGGTINNDKTITYNADYTKTSDVDLLYDNDKFGKYTAGTSAKYVDFNFHHLLSRVHFSVKNEIASNVDGNEYTYKVTDVKITNALPTGSYAITNFGVENAVNWTASGTGTEVSFGNVTSATKETDATTAVDIKGGKTETSHYSRLLIPNNYTALNIQCTITTYFNGSQVDVENYDKNIAINLEEGKAYNFVITLKLDEPIKFTATTMTDWDTTHEEYTQDLPAPATNTENNN